MSYNELQTVHYDILTHSDNHRNMRNVPTMFLYQQVAPFHKNKKYMRYHELKFIS